MKTVLCYGDSNTWGYDPVTADRLGAEVRWTGVLQRALGGDYAVIEEGLNGRTTVWDDSTEAGRNGKTTLLPTLNAYAPLDLVLIMLGTNDLKRQFNVSAADIADGAGALVEIVQGSASGRDGHAPPVLLICPPPFAPMAGSPFEAMMEGAESKSHQLAEHYQRLAGERGCAFFDAGRVIVSSPLDGFHLEASEHAKLGAALADEVRERIG